MSLSLNRASVNHVLCTTCWVNRVHSRLSGVSCFEGWRVVMLLVSQGSTLRHAYLAFSPCIINLTIPFEVSSLHILGENNDLEYNRNIS